MDSFGGSPKEGNIVFSEGLVMKRLRSLVAFVFLAIQAVTVHAAVVSFGTGTNKFSMEFVTIGNPGNAADTTGFPNPGGSVDYVYSIGKFEVSEDMIDKYNASYGSANSLEITKDTRSPNKPATSITWNEAARFVNWLNISINNHPGYKFTTSGVNDNLALWDVTNNPLDYDSSNPFRSKRAVFALPSYNEWYKAAYYDPNNVTYYDYPTGSDTPPNSVASGLTGAVYNNQLGPADVNQSGGLSPYGVMGLGGNVFEWEESTFVINQSNPSSTRGIRGGSWNFDASNLLSTTRYDVAPNDLFYHNRNLLGFRVVMLSTGGEVPEPSTFVIGSLLGLGGLARRRFSKK
jgi:hypothetical protein